MSKYGPEITPYLDTFPAVTCICIYDTQYIQPYICISYRIVIRITWLGNTYNFGYSANMLKKRSRGFDRAQYYNVNQI